MVGLMASETGENELIRLAQAGVQSALERLLVTHFAALQAAIGKRFSAHIQGVMSVDDVLQKTFERAAEKIADFEPRTANSFFPWLKTIAR